MSRPLALAALLLAAASPPVARAASAPDAGRPLEPTPASQAVYGTQPPDEDPPTQRTRVEGHDGTELYVETWLPAEREGKVPPAKVPTILIMTPYVAQGIEAYPENEEAGIPSTIEYFTSRGYAVAQHHVRGTGESGGCLEQTSANQIEDGARVVEYLGRDAPWSDGNVGMYGASYDAETQISTAGLGDPEKTKYLKALVPVATVMGQYEYSFFDGVPYTGYALQSNAGYLAAVSLIPGETSTPGQFVEKLGCQPEVLSTSGDQSGDMTEFWRAREYRPGVGNIRAPMLYVHGLRDFNVQPISIAGFFERMPATTPHKAMLGVWNHALPNRHTAVEPDWARSDWLPTALAWYDRYLKGLDTGVEDWPDVQIQDSRGQWRAEPDYPFTGGPAGQLALAPDGQLGGVAEPEGSTSYREGVDDDETIPGTRAVFETPAMEAPLHLTGQPVLDLWLQTSASDGHVAAKIELLGPDGERLRHEGTSAEFHSTYGMRSLRHLDPLVDNRFAQEQGKPAPAGEPLRVPLRFLPTDLVVPVGGKVRLTVAGAIDYRARDSSPSGSAPEIELLHDCEHTSALRFLVARPDAELLNVREIDEKPEVDLVANPVPDRVTDGGGLATARVCGREPERLEPFGPEFVPEPDPGTTTGNGTTTTGTGTTTGPGPAPQPDHGDPCLDKFAPRSRPLRRSLRVTRRGLRLRGRTTDTGCGSRLATVAVSVARTTKDGRCRFLRGNGRFTPARSCRRTGGTYLRARGTGSWSLRLRARLPRGRYKAWVRAIDAAGNVERKAARRNLVRFRVR